MGYKKGLQHLVRQLQQLLIADVVFQFLLSHPCKVTRHTISQLHIPRVIHHLQVSRQQVKAAA